MTTVGIPERVLRTGTNSSPYDSTRAKRVFAECPDGYRWILSGGYRIRSEYPAPYYPGVNRAARPEGTNGGWEVSMRRLYFGRWRLTVSVECMRSPF